MSDTNELYEDGEEVKWVLIGHVGDEVRIMSLVSPCGLVIISSLGYLLSFGSSFKPSNFFLTLYLRVLHIKDYFKNKRGEKKKFINPQRERVSHEEQRK